jgi:hypothetical protein
VKIVFRCFPFRTPFIRCCNKKVFDGKAMKKHEISLGTLLQSIPKIVYQLFSLHLLAKAINIEKNVQNDRNKLGEIKQKNNHLSCRLGCVHKF